MSTTRSKMVALLGIAILGVIFYSFSSDFKNKQVFPSSNTKVTKTLTSTIEDNAKANAQLQAALNGSMTSESTATKPAITPKNTIDSMIGSFLQSKLSKPVSKKEVSGKILYINNSKLKVNAFLFVPMKLGDPAPASFTYSLPSSVSFIEGSYYSHGGVSWCIVLKKGGVYQKSSNMDPNGSISFGKLTCRNGK